MRPNKSHSSLEQNEPLALTLLAEEISRISLSKQKLLWMQLNKKKLEALAYKIDSSVSDHSFTNDDINILVTDAKRK